MTKEISTFLHAILIMVQLLNAYGALAPKSWQVYLALGAGALQGILGVAAHYWNPDGTPASIAYTKEDK